MSLKNIIKVASFSLKNKLNLFLLTVFLFCGVLCLGAPAAPVHAIDTTLNSIPAGKVVYFGGRRFVKISAANSGVNTLWQANPEQQQPWHAATGYNNTATDFYSNSTKLGYWLTNTYTNLLNASQPTAGSWITSSNWTMGNETNESATSVTGKINLPSYSEWTANKSNYCLAVYGAECDSNMVLPYYFWLRTPYSSFTNYTWLVNTSGTFNISYTAYTYGVRPALNLISTIQACGSGDGLYDNPYFLGNGNCTTTNQPTMPTVGKIESFPAGTVIQMDDYKFIKMSDYLEPQRLNTSGANSNSYFVMADQYNTSAWDPDNTNGCTGGTASGTCGQPGGWTDVTNTNHIKNTLNTTFYNTLTINMQNMITDTAWPVGGTGDYAAENNEFIRTDTSKIALISNREWLQHGADYCKSRQSKVTRNCNSGSFTTSWWNRTPSSSSTSAAWSVNTSGTFSLSSTAVTLGVRPALNLISGISPYCGSGTYADPYMMNIEKCNNPPVLTVSSPTTGAILSTNAGYNSISLIGTVADVENDDQLIKYQFDNGGDWYDLAPVVTGLGGGAAKAFNYSISVAGLSAGAHTIGIRSFDGTAYSDPIISRSFSIDNVAPTLSISNSGTAWQNTVKSGVVSVSDAGAGVNRVTYTFATNQTTADTTFGTNCAGGTLTNNGASIPAPAGGANLFLCAMDNVGNISKASGVYNWENTKPVCTGWNPSTTNWVNTLIGTTFTPTGCSDSGGSGLVTPVPSCLTAATNNATCNVTVADNASNQETHISPAVKIDTLPPTISANGASTPWQNSVLNATISVADQAAAGANGQSGIARANYIWNTDNAFTPSSILGAACTNGTAVTNGTTLGSAAGGTTLYLCSIDNAGNVTFNQGRYNWENTPPTITQTPSFVADGANNIYLNNPTITITGSDIGGSQIDGIRFQWDTSFLSNAPATGQLAWQVNNQSTNIPAAGSHYLYYQARDNAGNISNVESVLYKFDSTPTTQILITDAGVSGNNGWFTTAPTATVYGRDVTNEVDTNENITDLYINFKSGEYDDSFTPITNYPLTSNDANHKYVANITPPTDSISNPTGIITLYYMSKNIAGTYSVVGHTTFKVDIGKPTGLLSVPIHTGGLNPLTFSFTASDSPSGLDVCNLQMSTVSIPTDLVLQGNSSILESDWSSWSTISNDCNGNYTQILDTDTGYRFQMNLLDLAGNTNQVKMNESVLDMIGLPVVFNRTPHLKVNNTDSNGNSIMGMMRYSPEAELGGTNTSDGTPIPQHTSFNISGTVSDSDPDQTLTVTATIAGVTKSQTISPKGANKGFLDNGFNLTWNGLEIATQLGGGDPLLSIPSLPATFSAIPVTVTDGQNMAEVNFNEGVTLFRNHLVIPRNDETRRIYNEALSKYTGTIYFPTASTPSIKTKYTGLIVPNSSSRPQTNSWYCYDTTGCQTLNDEPLDSQKSIQIWYKTIAGKEYPYQVRFYDLGSASFGSENRVSESGW